METIRKITTRKYEVTGPEIVGTAYDVRKIDSALQRLLAFGKDMPNPEDFSGSLSTAWNNWGLLYPPLPKYIVKWAREENILNPIQDELRSHRFNGTGKVNFYLKRGELAKVEILTQ